MNQDSGGDTTLTISAAALSNEQPWPLLCFETAMPAPNDSDMLLIDARMRGDNLTSFMTRYIECPRAFEFRTATEATVYATLLPPSSAACDFTAATVTPTLTGKLIGSSLYRRCASTPAHSVRGWTVTDVMDHIHKWQLFEALDDASRRPHPHRSHLTGRIRRALDYAPHNLRVLVLALLRASKRRRKALARVYKEPA